MIDETVGWRELPFRDEVSELKVVGNGKDCVLQVRVPSGRGFAIPLSSARTEVMCCEGVVIDTQANGDSDLEVCYRPLAGHRMRVARAKLNYPGSEEDWAHDCNIWERMSLAKWQLESSWAVLQVVVELATWPDTGGG